MKILVTGSTGFIGRNFVGGVVATGSDEVVCLIRRPDGATAGTRSNVAPLFDAATVEACVAAEAPEAIVHLAAAGVDPGDRDAQRLADVNVAIPAALVRAAARAGTKTVIVAGSSAEYARRRGPEPITEDAALEATKLYGATKAAGGFLAAATGHALGIRVIVLRLFNVFGAGEAQHRLLPSIVSSAREGRPIALSAGTQIRDFIAVDDVVRAIHASLAVDGHCLPTGHYNVCSGVGTTVRDFARGVVERIGADASLLQFGTLPLRPDDLPWLVGDPRRFHEATAWSARPLVDAIAGAVVGDEAVGDGRRQAICASEATPAAETTSAMRAHFQS